MKRSPAVKRKLTDWLWLLWEVGLLDEGWPPEEVQCD